MIICIILFTCCMALIAYSYLIYPLLLKYLVRDKRWNHKRYQLDEDLPQIAIMLSALNEESIIAKKIDSIFDTNYPKDKIHVYIGSDNSTDETNAILEKMALKYPSLKASYFHERRGKANVLNSLKSMMADDISVVVLTDANVLFTKDTLFHLAKHFKDQRIGQVGANIINYFEKNKAISQQENFYIQRENSIKYDEGLLNGSMIGAFGACYAVRRDLLVDFESKFLMEDFYLSLSILQKKYMAILDKEALCYEDLPGIIEEEYKRKRRISAGNYQNMMAYPKLFFDIFSTVGFCYWSHKLLRWLTPFLLIIMCLCVLLAAAMNFISLALIICIVALIAIFWILDIILEKAQKQIVILRFARYFILMNIAMLDGFIMYLKGIKTNVWTPTQREK